MTEIDLIENKDLNLGDFIDVANLPRKEKYNPFNYTELELIERKMAVDELEKKHPNVPRAWMEYAYDYCKNNDENEVKKVIDEGLWEKPLKERDVGGVFKNIEVINPGDDEYEKLINK
jgi:hypothetical protein